MNMKFACVVGMATALALNGCGRPRTVQHVPPSAESPERAEVVKAEPVYSRPATRDSSEASVGLREVFPGVRVDAIRGVVAFDAEVCIDAHSERTPRVYLEVLACAVDSKEHESLVMTRAKASHVHAALLLLGLEPGRPGAWEWKEAEISAIPPVGPRVRVEGVWMKDGAEVAEPLAGWAVNMRDGQRLSDSHGEGFVFAGSRMAQNAGVEGYAADYEGAIVGLTTFGSEVVAWTRMLHPDSGVHQPVWIADGKKMPKFGTRVVVRLTRME